MRPIERVRAQRAVRDRQQAKAAWIAEGERLQRQIDREIEALKQKLLAKKWWQFWL